MNVKQLIDKLLAECGDKDPATVKVELSYFDSVEYDTFEAEVCDVDSYGGNDYPLVVVIK